MGELFTRFIDSVYDGLLLQTKLKPYLDAIELTLDDTGLGFDLSGMENLMTERWSTDHREALHDLLDLQRTGGDMLGLWIGD
ncbi:MAG: hypothetical protein LBB51_01275 [Zoogloeaceae bacterium]|nr:hypothetical protein [Zoogloeaceae bacterium]